MTATMAMMKCLDRLTLSPTRRGGIAAEIAATGRRLGSGVDFADYRPYSPGDDPRHVDFRVYARTRRLFLRRFHVDSDLCLYILLDKSGSMGLGRSRKLDFAARLAKALAYVGSRGCHAVGLAAFADRLETWLPPSRSRDQLGRVQESLDGLIPGGRTNLGQVLTEFSKRANRRGLAVILSDFFTPQSSNELSILSRAGFDLAAIQILSEEEVAPDLPNDREIWDVEAEEEKRLLVGPEEVPRYLRRLEEWTRSLRERCDREGASSARLVSSASLPATVQTLIEAGLLQVRRA